ncbi:uncharacterized protein LOC123373101 isoform X1 [Mauremys mutica]|uniref:uncharacterized protein LOC123373101 isoform X1 n=1 Tax=Mauremys mutica TaxID=74926 RepID=UPI001D15E973|nr:uncharacterized protein LOC123373101 isoform X1 [Mauremys mutica]XP_044877821.1 uncharacterized protein LOC123373101 isoform X1 [Mauremys mutica]XP_044877822.1 uncharacterized protein LOC123373101 isoform X1 [Mauremys mutica]XP_044877823.1 uncharacterized protein LOC123373101 isoform X1 [Mauremys mutica]
MEKQRAVFPGYDTPGLSYRLKTDIVRGRRGRLDYGCLCKLFPQERRRNAYRPDRSFSGKLDYSTRGGLQNDGPRGAEMLESIPHAAARSERKHVSSSACKCDRYIWPQDEDQITFQAYCSAVCWLSRSPLETRFRGLFQTMTSGTIGKEQLQTLLQNLYPREDPKTIQELATLYLSEVDKRNQGCIDEEQFATWMKSFPHHMLTSVMHFPIIPSKITLLEELQPSFPTAAVAFKDRSGMDAKQLVTVAAEMSLKRRDWKRLANNLGLVEKDCFRLEQEHLDVKSQILAMLQIWLRTCRETPLPLLKAALRLSGNTDICNEVFSLNF